MSAPADASPAHRRWSPWPRGLAWLALLGPFFFLSYNFANGWAARHPNPGVVVFDWEHHIPFLPWTILPYWSIDLLYGLSFLLCRSPREMDRHGLRLLSAQLLSVACFIVFPLRFSFAKPPTDGLFGQLFDALAGFDQPFNQAPSLHISLLLILWVKYAAASRGPWRWLVHGWAALIGLSVLTTYQHHFIDLPTGLLAGALCLWLWPDHGAPPLATRAGDAPAPSRRLAACYLLGAALAAVGMLAGGVALWLAWPAVAMLLVALCYARIGARAFQKGDDGRHALGAGLLAAPYTLAAWLNRLWWTRHAPAPVAIADDVWLGRLPSRAALRAGGFRGLLDLCPELPVRTEGLAGYRHHDWLDLLPPSAMALRAAAHDLEHLRQHCGGPVWVACALGLSRSATAVAAWLLLSGLAATANEAVAGVTRARPGVVIGPAHRAALRALEGEQLG